MITRETRRELGRYDQCHANPDELLLKIVCAHVKPAEDWMNMAIFTQNSAGIGWMWPIPRETRRVTLKNCMDVRKTRRGLDEYGHFHAKPAED